MIELKGSWTDKDIDIFLKSNPNKIIIKTEKIFVKDVSDE